MLTPGNSPNEIQTLERVHSKMTRLLEHDPKDLSYDAMRAALAIHGQVEEIYAGTDQPGVRNAALVILNQITNLEEQVSNLAMVADMQGDIIQMNLEVIAGLSDQRDEALQDLSQARSEVERAFDDGYNTGVEMAGYGDPDTYDDEEFEEDLDEDPDADEPAELSEADLKQRQFERWVVWHDSLSAEELAAYRQTLTPEQRAWYADWCGWNGD